MENISSILPSRFIVFGHLITRSALASTFGGIVRPAHREGHHHAAGISHEDFRKASDISGNVQAE